jgi:hypothetical protein
MGDEARPHGLPSVLRQTVPAARPLNKLLRAQHGASLPSLVLAGDTREYLQLLRCTLVCVAKGPAAAPPQLPPVSQCSMVPRSSMNEARDSFPATCDRGFNPPSATTRVERMRALGRVPKPVHGGIHASASAPI